jgi:hypothetical protein
MDHNLLRLGEQVAKHSKYIIKGLSVHPNSMPELFGGIADWPTITA